MHQVGGKGLTTIAFKEMMSGDPNKLINTTTSLFDREANLREHLHTAQSSLLNTFTVNVKIPELLLSFSFSKTGEAKYDESLKLRTGIGQPCSLFLIEFSTLFWNSNEQTTRSESLSSVKSFKSRSKIPQHNSTLTGG